MASSGALPSRYRASRTATGTGTVEAGPVGAGTEAGMAARGGGCASPSPHRPPRQVAEPYPYPHPYPYPYPYPYP